MSEEQELNQARVLIADSKKTEAVKILWRLYESNNDSIKLNAILCLLFSIDQLTEIEKLIKLTSDGLSVAKAIGDNNIRFYLLAEKLHLLTFKFGLLVYRQKNLKLSANVFKWINFSTEEEQKEFECIEKIKNDINTETEKLESICINFIKTSKNNYIKGRVLLRLGDVYDSKASNKQISLMVGGKILTKLGNFYPIRRFGLDKWLLYNSYSRKLIFGDIKKCVSFFQSAISEFKNDGYHAEIAYAYYNLAVKYSGMFKFRKAKTALNLARDIAKNTNEKNLTEKIKMLYQDIAAKNKNTRNYVEEFGLDMP